MLRLYASVFGLFALPLASVLAQDEIAPALAVEAEATQQTGVVVTSPTASGGAYLRLEAPQSLVCEVVTGAAYDALVIRWRPAASSQTQVHLTVVINGVANDVALTPVTSGFEWTETVIEKISLNLGANTISLAPDGAMLDVFYCATSTSMCTADLNGKKSGDTFEVSDLLDPAARSMPNPAGGSDLEGDLVNKQDTCSDGIITGAIVGFTVAGGIVIYIVTAPVSVPVSGVAIITGGVSGGMVVGEVCDAAVDSGVTKANVCTITNLVVDLFDSEYCSGCRVTVWCTITQNAQQCANAGGGAMVIGNSGAYRPYGRISDPAHHVSPPVPGGNTHAICGQDPDPANRDMAKGISLFSPCEEGGWSGDDGVTEGAIVIKSGHQTNVDVPLLKLTLKCSVCRKAQ